MSIKDMLQDILFVFTTFIIAAVLYIFGFVVILSFVTYILSSEVVK